MDQEDYQVQQPEEEQEGQGDASTARDLDVSVEGGAAGAAGGGGIFSEYVIRAGGADGGGIFSEYAADDGEEAAEGGGGGGGGGAREVEHQERTKKVIEMPQKSFKRLERTKKVIVMLQKSFKRRVTAAPLQFAAMIQPVEEDAPPPSKHTAAVAFFELLGLHAKGFVNLSQPVAFGDISIAPQDRLMKQKVKLAA
ncbi:hypothetical protein T484DRAFT_1782451 [Baffinella frigidus]|nr:hypothetical protein T484DRAFT_1782451 [Cryptophyta sp. CCMP2293]